MAVRPPQGSTFRHPAVQAALKDLAEAAGQQSQETVSFKRPNGSAFGSPKVQAGLQALGEIAGQQGQEGAQGALYAAHNALNGGEISPEMLARYDQPRYQTGCEKLLNMVPMPQGGITKRPGMVSLGRGGTGTARLFPFVFRAGESRVLEFASTAEGSTVIVWFPDGTSFATGLSLPYGEDELAALSIAQSADVLYCAHRNHAPAKIMRYGDQDWRYAVVDWMPSISAPSIRDMWVEGEDPGGGGTGYKYVATAVDADTGEESLPSEARSVWAKSLSQTYFVAMTLYAVPNASEYRIYKHRAGVYGFVGSVYADGAGGALAGLKMGELRSPVGQHYIGTQSSAVEQNYWRPENSSEVLSDIVVEAHGSQNAFLFPSIGKALIRVAVNVTTTVVRALQEPQVSTSTEYKWVMITYSGAVEGTYGTGAWSGGGLGGGAENPVGSVEAYTVEPYYGEGGALGGGELRFEDRNIQADTEDTPPRAKNPFENGNNPSVVFFHQQRLGFASSDGQPLTIWLSQAGNFESMAASLPPEDDDAIEATLAATQANRILWCQSDRTSLAVGTEGGEWLLSGTEGAALTPSDLSFQPQTYHGSEEGLPVLRAGAGLVYMQRGGRVAREFGYSFSSDRYESGDLSLLARHILKESPVVSWAWQGEPCGIVWCVLANGKMAGLTYMREHDVVAWHRHETEGKVEDVVAVPGGDGQTQVWMHVVRKGVRYVERLAGFFDGGDASSAVHVDGADGVPFQARCIPSLPETSLQNGPTFLKVRKINAVKARVIRSCPFKARVGASGQLSVPARGAAYAEGHADWAVPLASGWRENDRLELIFDGPDPATVLGIVATVEVAGLGGGQK